MGVSPSRAAPRGVAIPLRCDSHSGFASVLGFALVSLSASVRCVHLFLAIKIVHPEQYPNVSLDICTGDCVGVSVGSFGFVLQLLVALQVVSHLQPVSAHTGNRGARDDCV